MNSRSLFFVVFALLATSAAAVFLAISVDRNIYAPGAGAITGHFGVREVIGHQFPQIYEHDLSTERILRKIYSIGAFAIVGFFVSPLFDRGVRIRAGTLLVMSFSLVIEIAQRFITRVSSESNFSSLFDIACGAVGGALGAVVWNVISARARRETRGGS